MNLKIKTGTFEYNNKILVSYEKFILGKNEKVNSLETPAIKNQTAFRPELRKRNSIDVLSHAPNISHKPQEPKTITHNDKKNCLGTFSSWRLCDMEYISINVTNLNT